MLPLLLLLHGRRVPLQRGVALTLRARERLLRSGLELSPRGMMNSLLRRTKEGWEASFFSVSSTSVMYVAWNLQGPLGQEASF
ncbi:hypothetical protein FIBSPDRAFT_851215 [Athelia psychrophila]|uniref:Uncharacterized protein n=1 Tax=Athelia psychrophila TaxID=1759441 RepID=A0A166SN17_9AGAM|nr:hypothetical protein FIBSPDRAFT_851215 [Fibularhizoctonia sp. CBS 109695]